MYKKGYSGNPATCGGENGKYAGSIIDVTLVG